MKNSKYNLGYLFLERRHFIWRLRIWLAVLLTPQNLGDYFKLEMMGFIENMKYVKPCCPLMSKKLRKEGPYGTPDEN